MMVLGSGVRQVSRFLLLVLAGFAELFLKRKLSFPLSRMWQSPPGARPSLDWPLHLLVGHAAMQDGAFEPRGAPAGRVGGKLTSPSAGP